MFTPGKWKVANTPTGIRILTDDNEKWLRIVPSIGMMGMEALDNIKLMAAAPDLLKELQALVHWLDGDVESEDLFSAKQTIQKATGGTDEAD